MGADRQLEVCGVCGHRDVHSSLLTPGRFRSPGNIKDVFPHFTQPGRGKGTSSKWVLIHVIFSYSVWVANAHLNALSRPKWSLQSRGLCISVRVVGLGDGRAWRREVKLFFLLFPVESLYVELNGVSDVLSSTAPIHRHVSCLAHSSLIRNCGCKMLSGSERPPRRWEDLIWKLVLTKQGKAFWAGLISLRIGSGGRLQWIGPLRVGWGPA